MSECTLPGVRSGVVERPPAAAAEKGREREKVLQLFSEILERGGGRAGRGQGHVPAWTTYFPRWRWGYKLLTSLEAKLRLNTTV